ncbi:MAG: spermidine synthase [Chloroflexota bacterium]|nr:spermidine synthase [Chloroflexota bacterium]
MTPRMRLVLLSFLMLFVELALIRWLGSNVVYLSFFSNLVLLGSFLGIGLGFIRARSSRNLTKWIPVALTFFIGFVLIARVEIDRTGDDLIYFGEPSVSGLPAWLMLPVIFLAVTGVMTLIGEAVGRQFAVFEPLEAYRLDIAGSLLGILGFSALSLLWAPPVAWALVAAVVMLVLFREVRRPLQMVAILGMVLILGRESLVPEYSWSPYYKLAVVALKGNPDYHITVNGIPHQDISSVADIRRDADSIYREPYRRAGDVEGADVLVIGAGTGTDVALALSEEVGSVDAVEIDPRLLEIGTKLHPDQPYSDARVSTYLADGREYLENTGTTYDLILFALPDSLTLVSGQGALRLESYLFTVEAMEAARERLRPDGVFAMYNYYREDWLVERLANTLETVYGVPACVDSVGAVGRLAMLTVGRDEPVDCEGGAFLDTTSVQPATDNYPFLYLRSPGLPPIYLVTVLLIVAASLGLVRGVGGPLRGMSRYVDVFFMGAAFLLLETKAVVQFALLFGTTWIVNLLVFAGVLLSVLLAVELARRVPDLPRTALYLVLFASLGIAFLVPPAALLGMAAAPRFALATALWFTPIFAANLIFAERFRRAEAAYVAFGTNLLGAMIGGVLEYLSLIVGFQLLVIVVAALYFGAFLAGREVPIRIPGLARFGVSS